jgi:hypothetical protein
MFAKPFSRLKICRFKATVHKVAHLDVKTESSDHRCGGFCYNLDSIAIFFVTHRGTSLRAANVRGLVFTGTATTF